MSPTILVMAFIAGVVILRYAKQIYRFTGQDPDAERVFGSGLGGTYTAIRLFGVILVVGSVIVLLLRI